MRKRLIINSNGKAGRKPTVRPSLPYIGIARRAVSDTAVNKAIEDYLKAVAIIKK